MATVRITYFGMDGEGKNVTDAKKDAGRKIESAMTGDYQPRLLESRGTAIVLWRDPFGWRSNFISHKGAFRPQATAFQCYSSGSDYWDAYATAFMSLAQDTWDGQERHPGCFEAFADTADVKRRLMAEFDHWRGFQLAYKHAKANNVGQGDCDWHRWACDHGREFESNAA